MAKLLALGKKSEIFFVLFSLNRNFARKIGTREMKRTLLVVAMLAPLALLAQSKWNQHYQQYIDQYKDIAIEQMQKWKVPASITLAQGILESGAGRSDLAVKGNNHFGIKCHGWDGATMHHNDDANGECFRVYSTPYESFEDHSRFLAERERYRSLFSLKPTDYQGWAKGLKAAGYATNPKYASLLIDLIQLYKLYRYDQESKYDKLMVEHAKDMPAQGQATLHAIGIYNKNYYVKARRGDSFKAIGEEIGVSYKKIARYNERDRNDRLVEGEIVWLKKKQKRAPKEYKDHLYYAKRGDSMYSIAQKFGIRLKSLYKLNKMKPTDELRIGQGLRLR